MTPFFVFSFYYVMSFFNLKEEKTLSQDSEYVNEEVPDVVEGPSWLKKYFVELCFLNIFQIW